MNEYLSSFMMMEGFTPVNTNLRQFSIFLKKETGHVTAVFSYEIQPSEPVSELWYSTLRKSAMDSLIQAQFPEIHPLFLLITQDTVRAAEACMQDRNAWVINPVTRSLIIPTGHVEDFYGLKGRLGQFLQDPTKAYNSVNQMRMQYQARMQEEQRAQRAQSRNRAAMIPWVSIGIAALNILIYGICFLTGDYYLPAFDLDPERILQGGQWYRVFTYMYLHSGPTHLFNNMIMLYVEGNVVEPAIGRWKYLIFYHLLGVLAGLGSLGYKYFIGTNVPSVGASGAIMGIMGILLYITIRNFRALRRGGSRIFMLALCGVDSLYQGFYMKNVDNAAHVTGMLAGIVIGIIIDTAMRSRALRK